MRFVRGSISPLGGCVVSDVVSVSPTRLATYATCPRQYEFSHVQNVSSPDETKFYMYQGRVYHETIETVCEQTGRDDDAMTIYERALDAFDEKWAEHIDPSEYASAAHQEYQRRENLAGIKAFFDPDGGVGIEHARMSVATEKRVECERNGIGLHGDTDNVLRDGDTLHLVDYKRNVKGVLGHWSGDRLVEHLEAEVHEAQRVKNAFQTAAYIEGIKDSELYEPGMTVRFSFYGLLHSTDVQSTPDGYRIRVSDKKRETTEAYTEYHDTIWSLIEAAHDGITGETYDPEPLELIREEMCGDCEYQAMCPEYLTPEVQR